MITDLNHSNVISPKELRERRFHRIVCPFARSFKRVDDERHVYS